MKKTIFFITPIMIFFSVVFFPEETKQFDLFTAALNEKDPLIRLQKLENYYYNNRGQKQHLNKNVFLHIVYTASQLKNFQKVIQFGERGLTYKWNNEIIKLDLYLNVANAYVMSGINFTKAYDYAEFVITAAKLMVNDKRNVDLKKKLILQAYYLQIKILDSESMDLKTIEKALEKSIKMYQYEKSSKSAYHVFYFSKRLYTQFHKHDKAIEILENICMDKNPNPEYLNILALWYSRKEDKEKAIYYLKKSYNLKKNAKVAYTLGKLLQKIDIDAAIEYLADAYLLKDRNVSGKAQKLLEHLHFNIKVKKKSPQEQEQDYKIVIDKAKTRLRLNT